MGWFVRVRLLAHPLRLLAALPFIVIRHLLLRFACHRSWTSRLLVRIAMAGLTAEEYVRIALGIGREMAHTSGFPVSQGLDALRGHLRDGDTVIVATGSEYHVATGFLTELGITDVKLLASSFDRERGHVALHHYCVGRRKREDVRGVISEPTPFVFYTDSTDDLPLARSASHIHLINPDRRTRTAYSTGVQPLTVHAWTMTTAGRGSSGVEPRRRSAGRRLWHRTVEIARAVDRFAHRTRVVGRVRWRGHGRPR
jgi:phosphatidylglycerophosphatase C